MNLNEKIAIKNQLSNLTEAEINSGLASMQEAVDDYRKTEGRQYYINRLKENAHVLGEKRTQELIESLQSRG